MDYWLIFLALAGSFLPILEVRWGIPVAMAAGLHPVAAYFMCVLANIAALPCVFFFLDFIHHRFMHHGHYQWAFDKFMEKTRHKAHPYVEKYGAWGLLLFVSLPLPGTGGYTGALAAWFFDLSRWKSYAALIAGRCIEGVIVLLISFGGFKVFGWI
jgi:uncharacterized membrane protein